MHVLLALTFKAAKTEPLAALLARVAAAFREAGITDPAVKFSLSESPVAGGVSSVDRALKRWPDMAAYVDEAPSLFPGMPPVRSLTSSAPGAPAISLGQLAEIAAGVPKSFPFHSVSITLSAPGFDTSPDHLASQTEPGFTILDTWWATGRRRALTAQFVVQASVDKKCLPPLPEHVAAIAGALGSYKTVQMPLAVNAAAMSAMASATATAQPEPSRDAVLTAEASTRIAEVVRRHRETFAETVKRAALPHDLPSAQEATRAAWASRAERKPAGAKKGALQKAFKSLGYEVTSGTGTFTLRRRTAGNLCVEVHLDVGTWSRQLTASYRILGLGFAARHPLAISAHDGAQLASYPIVDADQWRKLVENLAALVAEIDKTFPIEIEAAAGPSPAWFEPAAL